MSDSSSANRLGESPAVDITGKIMVMMIIVLFMFVVSFLFFHLYAKGFFYFRRSSNNNNNNNNNSQSRRRHDGLVRSSTGGGLDPLVLRSLPVSIFQIQSQGGLKKDVLLECSVCLSEFVEGEKMRLLPKCNHGFHVDCIDMWFQSHSTCPLCRTSLSLSDDHNIAASSSPPLELAESHHHHHQQSFPTNVLIWGNQNQTQITSTSTSTASSSHPPSSSSSSSSSGDNGGMLVIDIPTTTIDHLASSSSATATATAEDDDDDEMKSPVMRTLRSMKRLLSNNMRLNPWTTTPTSTDIMEQGKAQQEQGHN